MKRKYKLITATLLTVLMTMLTVSTFTTTSVVDAGIACDSLGPGLHTRYRVNLNLPHKGEANRRLAMNELYGRAVEFTSFNGIGEGTWIMTDTSSRGAGYIGMDDQDVLDRLESWQVRNLGRCATGGLGNDIANGILGVANSITGLSQTATSLMFNTNFLCSTASDTDCINLVGVLAGTGGANNGIVGMLYSSIFLPLVVILAAVAALMAFIKVAKGSVRDAFSELVWTISAFIVGVMLMTSPTFLVTLPQNITSTISGCVIMGINGENCLSTTDSEGISDTILVPKECQVTYGGKRDTETLIAGMNCGIWKTFIMEPWAEAQFGLPYNELYTANAPENGAIWEAMPQEQRDKIGVLTGSISPISDSKNKLITLDMGDKIYNAAYYQLYIKTFAQTSGDTKADDKAIYSAGYDERWFNIIPSTAKDNAVWGAWAGTGVSSFSRIGAAFTALFTSTAASVLFIMISIFGLAYKFAGPILIAFAPFFFLMAIVPGKGRKLFLGWVESTLSSIYKYSVSAIMLIMALAIYSGTMNSMSGGARVITVIVITATFMVYRKELINILGASSLGGTKLTNKVAEGASKVGKSAKRLSDAVVGGTVGGVLAGGSVTESMGESLRREAKRGRGATQEMMRQFDRQKARTDADMKNKDRELDEQQAKDALAGEGEEEINKDPNDPSNNNSNNDSNNPDNNDGDVEVKGDGETDKNPELEELRKNAMSKKATFNLDEAMANIQGLSDEELIEALSLTEHEPDSEEYIYLSGERNRRMMSGDIETIDALNDYQPQGIAQMDDKDMFNIIQNGGQLLEDGEIAPDDFARIAKSYASRGIVPQEFADEVIKTELGEDYKLPEIHADVTKANIEFAQVKTHSDEEFIGPVSVNESKSEEFTNQLKPKVPTNGELPNPDGLPSADGLPKVDDLSTAGSVKPTVSVNEKPSVELPKVDDLSSTSKEQPVSKQDVVLPNIKESTQKPKEFTSSKESEDVSQKVTADTSRKAQESNVKPIQEITKPEIGRENDSREQEITAPKNADKPIVEKPTLREDKLPSSDSLSTSKVSDSNEMPSLNELNRPREDSSDDRLPNLDASFEDFDETDEFE